MGKGSSIEWTDHTFNAWHGCEKVSPACTNCYAEAQSVRYGFKIWGKAAPRRFFGQKHWNEPHRWDIEAKVDGVRRRVFVNSMSDTFEDRPDLVPWRLKLFDLIQDCRGLDWLLLTKRPQNIRRMVPRSWLNDPPLNVWFGTTVENQEEAGRRIPDLLQVPARIRFLSCEPLLAPVNLKKYFPKPMYHCSECGRELMHSECQKCGTFDNTVSNEIRGVDWVIAGGESGSAARATEKVWIEKLRDDCSNAGVPFFFKQLGTSAAKLYDLQDHKGADPAEWPEDLRVQQFPSLETE